MTPHVAILSMLFGVAWHTIVVLLMGQPLGDAGSLGILAGAVAGLCAGSLTVRSRERHHGRESIFDGILTYYVAVIVYVLTSVVIGVVVDAYARGSSSVGPLGFLAASWVLTWYAVLFASLAGVLLVPLCFLTRRFLWRFSGRMRPNKA